MSKISEPKAIGARILELTKNNISKHTCQIFKEGTKYKYEPKASGVLIEILNGHYLLTASHVTQDNENLFINSSYGMIPIEGKLRESDLEKHDKLDVAYIQLDYDLAETLKKTYRFLTINNIWLRHQTINTTQYLTYGFPEKNIRRENGKTITGGELFVHPHAKEKVYQHYEFDPAAHILVEFAGKGTDLTTNLTNKINTEPHGMSGCGLWFISLTGNEQNFKLDYQLIGIMAEFRKKYCTLVSCRIELIISDLLQLFHGTI